MVTVPENASDPLYTNWVKEGPQMGGVVNPIVNGTGDDPTTAWQTKDKEWRMLGNQKCPTAKGAPIYGSMDFKSWYKVGCTTLTLGDCPTLFPLPALTPGSERYLKDGDSLPTHVHKAGSGNDQVQLGTWTDGAPGQKGTPGTWVQFPGSTSVPCDNGNTHASKDFYDPVKKRRILWIWGTVPSGIQALPRVMTYHPGIKQIVYTPAEEIEELRDATPLATIKATALAAEKPVPIAANAACDITVSFARPAGNATLSVNVGASSAGEGGTGSVQVVYTHESASLYYVSVMYVPTPSSSAIGGSSSNTFAGAPKTIKDKLPLLAEDSTIDVRMFVDGTVGEAYFMGGRVAFTFELGKTSAFAGIVSSAAGSLSSASAWGMNNIWTTTDEILATPRAKYVE